MVSANFIGHSAHDETVGQLQPPLLMHLGRSLWCREGRAVYRMAERRMPRLRSRCLKSSPRVSVPKRMNKPSVIRIGAMIIAAVTPKAGTRAVMLKACAKTPPPLVQAATQPVARPRILIG